MNNHQHRNSALSALHSALCTPHSALCTLHSALFLILFPALSFAQGPGGSGTYYLKADGAKGKNLKTQLFQVINNHVQRTYNALWEDFRSTDARPDGKVWDMYSNATNYTFGTDQAGTYKVEGDVYNREHSFPKSWFSEGKPMYTDIVHLVPTDGYVNGRRSNYPFGETEGEKYKSKNGFSKLGVSTLPGYSGIVFEPNDEYKGDFARIYFYMATCYEDKIASWSCDMLDGTSYPAYTSWVIDMFLRWAKEDPVSDKEIQRNKAIYSIQQNRNPFVDYPGLEQYIWGDLQGKAFSYDKYENPTAIHFVEVQTEPSLPDETIYNLQGVSVGAKRDFNSLPSGIYIYRNKKVVVK